MKNLSILFMAVAGILLLSSCAKDADSVSPNYSSVTASLPDSMKTGSSCNGQNKPGQKPPKPEEVMAKLDTDQDQLISKREAQGPLVDDFDRIDANKDGFISLEELKKGCPPPPAANNSNN